MQFKCEFTTIVFIVNWLFVAVSHGKSIDRCEFVHELKHFNPQIDYHELNAWTCIAQYQSNFNTSSKNTDASGATYHGIFQISDVYWCSNNWQLERSCKIRCDQLHDVFLKDDFDCVKRIYAEHLRIHGNGFTAWPIYQQYCSDGRDVIKDCTMEKKPNSGKSFQQKDKAKAIAEKKAHKIYERCELARELHFIHNLPFDQIATWVCIARYESNYNTSAVGHLNGDGSLDHGLFQISDIFWCSPPGRGWVCGLSCAKLENSDISDDVECMKKIYDEHQRLSGDGFNAWSVYPAYCKHNVDQFIAGCFDTDTSNEIIFPMHRPGIIAPASIEKPAFKKKTLSGGGKVFSKCELAKELRYKHNLPKDQIHTWVCIAQTLSSLNTAFEAPKNADGSSSHGLFQINDQYWCDVNGIGKGCNINCGSLKDGDIADDVQCVQTIFNEHQKLFGNGFGAWGPYENHCKYETENSLSECFANEPSTVANIKPNSFFLPAKSPEIEQKSSKIYKKCELARELRNVHNIPLEQLHAWVCIANHESRFDTAAIGRLNGDGSLDHGLFQISDIYWCSNSGQGKGCNAACSDFRNADISDDVRCVKQIYDEHQRLFGAGFHAWTVYEPHCRHQTNQYISDCFSDEIRRPAPPPIKPTVSILSNSIIDQGRAYEKCDLAKELRWRHNTPKDQIADWVCIALYSSNLATSAKGQNSHGLFQINNEYWCSNDGNRGKQCNLDCSTLEDSDITDDYQCAKLIYDTHQKLYGSGFGAWNVYEPYCRGRSSDLIAGCFDDISVVTNFKPSLPKSFSFNANNQITNTNSIESDGNGKVYERCELARELRYKYNLPLEQIHTWICIIQHESNFDTSAIGRSNADGSLDHGLFQISDIYWCSNTGVGKACSASCASFRDANIDNDVQCIKRIFDEHERLFGSGWNAWTTYEPFCKHTTSSFVDDCFANNEPRKNDTKILSTLFVQPVAASLTPLNQFKHSTFAPFTPAPPTKKIQSATAQFVNYYTTSTTQRPSFGTVSRFTTKSPTTPVKFPTFAAAFPTFGTQSTTPASVQAPIGIKTTNQHTIAALRNNFFTTTTPKPSFPLNQLTGFSKKTNQLPTPAPQTLLMPKTTTQKSLIKTVSNSAKPTSSSKFNLFDLYLGRLTTKAPERYTFPTPAPKNSITFANHYAVRPTQATSPIAAPSFSVNSYRLSDTNKIQSTTTIKPTSKQFETFAQSQVSNIAQSPRIFNSTHQISNAAISTTPKPRVWRYSFTGIKQQ